MSAPEGFQRVGRASDLPYLEGRNVTVAGTRIAVFHAEHGYVALGASCPHRGGPLADGIVSEHCVTCPLHNWRIDLQSGEVVSGGEGRVPTYEVAERDGDLYVGVPVASRSEAPVASESGLPVANGCAGTVAATAVPVA